MCVTTWWDIYWVFITTVAATIIVFASIFIAALELLGARAEKKLQRSIEEATGYNDGFN